MQMCIIRYGFSLSADETDSNVLKLSLQRFRSLLTEQLQVLPAGPWTLRSLSFMTADCTEALSSTKALSST